MAYSLISEGPSFVKASSSPPTVKIRFIVYDPQNPKNWSHLTDGTYINIWVQIYWFSDPGLGDPQLNGDPTRVWPATGQEWLSSWRYCDTTPLQFQMDPAAWARLKRHPTVYRRAVASPRREIPPTAPADYSYEFVARVDLRRFDITRVPPIADAGTSRPFLTGRPPQGLLEDLVLDGSRSYDPDGDPLKFQWEVTSGPCAPDLPWQMAHFGQRSAVALRAGTTIPKQCLGTYGFKLTVSDPQAASVSTVQHTLGEVNHVPIASPGAARIWQLGAGYRLQEDVVLDGTGSSDPDGDPLFYGWSVEGGRCAKSLPWLTQAFTQASPIALPAQTVIGPHCLGPYTFRLTVSDSKGGVNSSEVQHEFQIKAPTLRILKDAPTVIEYLQLGREGIRIPVEQTAANGAVVPDSYELQVQRDGTQVGGQQIPATDIAQGFLIWKGELYHDSPRTGIYSLTLVARTEGLQLAYSNEHDVRVVDIIIELIGSSAVQPGQSRPGTRPPDKGPFSAPDLESGPTGGAANDGGNQTGQFPGVGVGVGSDAGATTPFGSIPLEALSVDELFAPQAYAISEDGPTMPQLTVRVTARGFPPGHQALWGMRLAVTYEVEGHKDVVEIPFDDWLEPDPKQGTEWKTVPTKFCGGYVTAFCRTTFEGQELIGRSYNDRRIWGVNPRKSVAQAEFGTISHQVAVYLASRFTQFGEQTEPQTIDTKRYDVATVLRRNDRYGLGGLTEPVTPLQLWNWRENAKETVTRLAQDRADAGTYQAQVQTGKPWDERTGGFPPGQGQAYPDAPQFTNDQLDLEMWSRYAGGLRYHDYVPAAKTWMRRAEIGADGGASLGYAEDAEFVRDSVRAEQYPSGWHDEDPFSAATSSVAVNVIKELRKDARAGQALDILMAAGWTAHMARLTLARPSRADIDKRQLLIHNISISDQLRANWLVGAIRLAFRGDKALRLRSENSFAFETCIRHDLTALDKAADVYQWSAWYHEADVQALLDDMMLIFTDLSPRGIGRNGSAYYVLLRDDPRTGKPIILSWDWSTGFKREFRDDSNQVRHMTGSLQTCHFYRVAGLVIMQYREIYPFGPADIRLNNRCAHIAANLPPFGGGPAWQLADIGQILRRELGDPLQTDPWDGLEFGDPDP